MCAASNAYQNRKPIGLNENQSNPVNAVINEKIFPMPSVFLRDIFFLGDGVGDTPDNNRNNLSGRMGVFKRPLFCDSIGLRSHFFVVNFDLEIGCLATTLVHARAFTAAFAVLFMAG